MSQILRNVLIAGGCGVAASYAGRAILRQYRHFDWAGKSVVVTGGSRGLGLCLARVLIDAGANVTICARSAHELNQASAELRLRDGGAVDRVLHVVCDVRDKDAVAAMVSQTVNRFGGVDVLVNNAGIIGVGPFDAMTEEDFKSSMETNCWGTLNTVRAVLPYMRVQGWGRILNVASLGGKRAIPHMLPYAASSSRSGSRLTSTKVFQISLQQVRQGEPVVQSTTTNP